MAATTGFRSMAASGIRRGPSFQLQGCANKFSYYLTGLYLQSNLGFSSAVAAPDPIHDAVKEGQGFGYFTYQLTPLAKLSLMTGATYADSQFPNVPGLPPAWQLDDLNPAFYPSTAINSRLDQQDYFGVLALDGVVGEEIDYQLAYSTHYNNQNFHPDPVGELIYNGVSSHVFNSDFSNSLEGDLTYRFNSAHTIGAGFYFGAYGIEVDDHSLVFNVNQLGMQNGTTPISRGANLNKINLVYGVYLQDTWNITRKLSVNYGSRWDLLDAFSVNSQFSPTINFVYKAREDTTLHAGFARYFQIPNFQGISPAINNIFAGTSGSLGVASGGNLAPLPETDYYWDVGFTHQVVPNLVWGEDNYFRIDRHYLDEGQFGAVPIDAPLNYKRGYGGGVENTLTYNLPNLSMRLNVFVSREENIGVATGQYNFDPVELAYLNRHYFVLDHTPLVGGSGGVAYRWRDYLFTFDGLFSSGLRGGFADQEQLPKVWQFNLSASRFFNIPKFGKAIIGITVEHLRPHQSDSTVIRHRGVSSRRRGRKNYCLRRAHGAVAVFLASAVNASSAIAAANSRPVIWRWFWTSIQAAVISSRGLRAHPAAISCPRAVAVPGCQR